MNPSKFSFLILASQIIDFVPLFYSMKTTELKKQPILEFLVATLDFALQLREMLL